MTRNFCTYFDKNYLLRGITLHSSLIENCHDFHLWIWCIDDETHDMLSKLRLEKVTLIKSKDFEDPELLAVKKDRTPVEYYWTCSPSLPLYVLKQNPEIDHISYLDADLFFFSSPETIFEEMAEKSIMIIPQRFASKERTANKTKDLFNVGMMIWKNDSVGREALISWRKQCLEWCYNRFEDGKHGDQGYLNEWPEKWKSVCVLKNEGGNLGPWDVRKYNIYRGTNLFNIENKETKNIFPLIFYHFHASYIYLSGEQIHFYPIKVFEKQIYKKYLEKLNTNYQKIKPWNYGLEQKPTLLKRIKQEVFAYLRKHNLVYRINFS
jgi:hypothetical protein